MLTPLIATLLLAGIESPKAQPAILSPQAQSRGVAVAYPPVFDDTGTETSRASTAGAAREALKKGGFKMVTDEAAKRGWSSLGYKKPTLISPPKLGQLVKFGKSVGADFVVSTKIHFHTRSIWVNLGPKTISNCVAHVTVVDTKKGQIVYEREAEGRSDERSGGLKVAGAILISPLVTAVSGGPKTPQEQRAGQIAVARAIESFVVVD